MKREQCNVCRGSQEESRNVFQEGAHWICGVCGEENSVRRNTCNSPYIAEEREHFLRVLLAMRALLTKTKASFEGAPRLLAAKPPYHAPAQARLQSPSKTKPPPFGVKRPLRPGFIEDSFLDPWQPWAGRDHRPVRPVLQLRYAPAPQGGRSRRVCEVKKALIAGALRQSLPPAGRCGHRSPSAPQGRLGPGLSGRRRRARFHRLAGRRRKGGRRNAHSRPFPPPEQEWQPLRPAA